MKKVSKFFILLLLCVGFVSFTSCDDDEPETGDTDEIPSLPDVPTVDMVTQTFEGDVINLASIDGVMAYVVKRFNNVYNSLDDNADLVLLDESSAQSIINDQALFSRLLEMWQGNTAVGFVCPASYSLRLKHYLDYQETPDKSGYTASQADVERYANIQLYVTTASRQYLLLEKQTDVSTSRLKYINTADSDELLQNSSTSSNEIQAETLHTDYTLGQCAEKAIGWINDYYTGVKGRSDASFFNSTSSEYTYQPAKYHVIVNSFTIYHGTQINHLSKGIEDYHQQWFYTTGDGWTLTPEIIVTINSGYYEPDKQDFYDVQISESFPGSYDDGKTDDEGNLDDLDGLIVHNFCFYDHLAYNYRYSGGIYVGPSVEAWLSNASNSFDYSNTNVLVESAVPQTSVGTTTDTHYPGNWTVGGGVSVGASADGLDVAGSFSFGYTFPTSTISVNHSEMPVNYQNVNLCKPTWNYLSELQIFESHWGLNPSFNYDKVTDLPECNYSTLQTDQLFTFLVANTQQLKDTKTILNLNVQFKLYYETCGPEITDFYPQSALSYHEWSRAIELPVINRYFGTYRPSLRYSDASSDSDGWSNIETMLLQNPDYRAFATEEIRVGGTTEEGVVNNAVRIWENCIEEIAEEYQYQKTDANTYIVALKNEGDNTYFTKGIKISTDGWNVVNIAEEIAKLK